ncbi:hypothetical protein [Saccharopolyspora sp. NPDC002376]
MKQQPCCCAEWHRTMRMLIVTIATLAHGLMLAGQGMLPLA